MIKDWDELTSFTRGVSIVIERVRLLDQDVVIEGQFQLPPLAKLTVEDQMFVAAFVRAHGSIKQMESLFGISYPTVKNRIKQISQQLGFADVQSNSSTEETLDLLESSEISVDEAIQRLKS